MTQEKETASPLLCCQTRARDILWINPFYVVAIRNGARSGDEHYLVTTVNGDVHTLVHPSRDEFIAHVNRHGG